MRKYKVKHLKGEDIIEADGYYMEGLSTSRVAIFLKDNVPIKHFILVKSIDRIEDEKK